MSITATSGNVKKLRKRLEQDRADALLAAADLAGSTNAADLAEFQLATSRAVELEQTLGALPKVEVRSEPDVYSEGDPYGPSFFRDLVAVSVGDVLPGTNSTDARDRLRRHSDYMESRRSLSAAGAILSMRGIVTDGHARSIGALPGQGEAFVPPTWLEEYWSSVVRAACPLRRLATCIELPPYGSELIIPRFAMVSEIEPMAHENEDVPDPYQETGALKSQVRMFADAMIVSQQLYERGGSFADMVACRDMAEAYAQSLQEQLMIGTGEGGDLLGLLNVAGASLVTYTSGSPTVPELVENVGIAAAKVSNKRKRPPSAILMRGNRWFQIAGTADKNSEPTMRPGTGSIPRDTDVGPFGPLLNLGVYIDDTLPENQGAGTNQDIIAVLRAQDLLLLEEPAPRFNAYAEGGTAGQMSVFLGFHAYASSFPQRFPESIASVQGTGLVLPDGYR